MRLPRRSRRPRRLRPRLPPPEGGTSGSLTVDYGAAPMEQGAAPQPTGQGSHHWAVEPFVAWSYLALNFVFAFTPLWPVSFALGVAAAVVTYQERRRCGLPAGWWVVAILIFGPLAFLAFVYKRSRPTLAYPPGAPPPGAEAS
jgi:hypothetical protein